MRAVTGTSAASHRRRQRASWLSASSRKARSTSSGRGPRPTVPAMPISVGNQRSRRGSRACSRVTEPPLARASAAASPTARSEGPEPSTATRMRRGSSGSAGVQAGGAPPSTSAASAQRSEQ